MILVQVAVGHFSGFQLNQLLPVPGVNVSVVGGGQITLRSLNPIPDGLQAAAHHVLPPLHLVLAILQSVMLCCQAWMIPYLQSRIGVLVTVA